MSCRLFVSDYSTVLSLSSGCRSSLSRPWKLWPLQGGWGQIRRFHSHHSPACSERPAPFRFHQLLFCSSSPTSFPCLLTSNVLFFFAHSVASSCRLVCWSLLCLSQFCPWLVTKRVQTHPPFMSGICQSLSITSLPLLHVNRCTFPACTVRKIYSLNLVRELLYWAVCCKIMF